MNLDDIYSQMNLLSHAYEESDYEIKYMHKQSDMLRERAGTNKRLHEIIDEREAILVSFQNDCDSKYNEIKSSLIKEKAEQEEEQSSQENENGKNKFFEDFMREIKTEDQQLLEEIRELRMFFSDFKNGIQETEQFIMQRYPQIYQQISRAEYGHSGFISSSRLENRKHYHPSAQISQKMNYEPEGTTLLEAEMETTLLTDEEEGTVLLYEPQLSGKLIRQKDGAVVNISTAEFRIGKSQDNDYCIPENRAISRKHATVYYDNGVYVIVDNGSTNHSYVNGTQIESYNNVMLNDGDIIRLADEDFIFKNN